MGGTRWHEPQPEMPCAPRPLHNPSAVLSNVIARAPWSHRPVQYQRPGFAGNNGRRATRKRSAARYRSLVHSPRRIESFKHGTHAPHLHPCGPVNWPPPCRVPLSHGPQQPFSFRRMPPTLQPAPSRCPRCGARLCSASTSTCAKCRWPTASHSRRGALQLCCWTAQLIAKKSLT